MTLVPVGYKECILIYGYSELYTEQPPGYVARRIKCRLNKAIYGLKQSSRAWYEKFSITISGIDFHKCHSDFFCLRSAHKSSIVVLVVYVDDFLLTDNNSTGLLETKEYLKCHFVIKNMRRPKYFLGIEVAYQKT